MRQGSCTAREPVANGLFFFPWNAIADEQKRSAYGP